MKTYISEKPFRLLGYTLDEYLRWCEKHSLKPYETESKRIFFKKINEHTIIKIKNKILEEGREL